MAGLLLVWYGDSFDAINVDIGEFSLNVLL